MENTILTNATNSSSNATLTNVVKANHATLIAWLVLNVWPSHFGLPLLISTTLFFKCIKRHATFVNLCITWMMVGIFSSLLLYAGYTTGPEPPKALCIIQASLLYGQPGMTSLSAFALVFQVFYVVRGVFREKDFMRYKAITKWTLLVSPYAAFAIFAVITAYVGATNPSRVSRGRRFFYCSVKATLLTNAITGTSFAVLLMTLILEGWIALITYKNWRFLRDNDLKESNGLNLNLIIRTSAFGLWVILGMGLSILSMRAPESPIPDMALATMGSAVVLVFGTQRDILRTWCFWRCTDQRSDQPTFSQQEVTVVASWPEIDIRSNYDRRGTCIGWTKRKGNRNTLGSFISSPVLQPDKTSIPSFDVVV